jgi:hypothetical protein
MVMPIIAAVALLAAMNVLVLDMVPLSLMVAADPSGDRPVRWSPRCLYQAQSSGKA